MAPLAALVAAIWPQTTNGWQSACSCLNDDAEFAYFVTSKERYNSGSASADLDKELNEDIVASGFLAKIPVGSSMQSAKKLSQFMERDCTFITPNKLTCDYWLQYNKTTDRGYAVDFLFSPDHALASIVARKIYRLRRQNAA
ncbi:MAG: hypothetical protein AB1899_18575 [Pseudomonadota bacterium]